MTLGEFELNDVILDKSLAPFDVDVRLLLLALMFLMTIVVMNLTVWIYDFMLYILRSFVLHYAVYGT